MRLAIDLIPLAAPALASGVENPMQPSPLWEELRSGIIGTED
jgi:sulfur-oxidizing protein SoxY